MIFDKKSNSRIWRENLSKFKTPLTSMKFKKQVLKNEIWKIAKTKKKQKINESWKKTFNDVINIATIDAVSFNLLTRRKNVKIFVVSLKNVKFEMTKKNKAIIDSKVIIFEKYYDFLNIFSNQKANKFFSHRRYNYKIEFEKRKKVLIRTSLYRMFKQELKLIKIYFEKHLNKNFIPISFASFASLILFAKKFDEKLRFCVNYWKLNEITKKNRYFIFLIMDLITQLSKTKSLIKIDI